MFLKTLKPFTMAALIQHNYMYQQFPGTKSQNDEKSVMLSSPTESIPDGSRFVGYTSFDNHDHKKTAEFLKEPGANTTHIVREKIDGSHFSIMYKNGDIMFCRRKGILQTGELFRGYDKFYPKGGSEIADLLLALPRQGSLRAQLILKASWFFNAYGNHYILHGELFGNSWEGTKSVSDFPAFQTKVEYTPSLETLWYDIWDSKTNSYLPVDKANEMFQNSGFTICPIIATYSSLSEALEHPSGFTSTISSLYVKEPHSSPNLAEGIVISPVVPYYYRSSRAIIKKKHSSFVEKARRNNKSPKKRYNRFEFLDDLCCGEAGENRFTAVRSKLCDVVSKSWMANEYVVDVLSDLDPDSPYAMFSTGEKLAAEKYIKKKIGHLIARM